MQVTIIRDFLSSLFRFLPNLLLLFSLIPSLVYAQQQPKLLARKQYPRGNFIPPIPPPLALSGSFGSVRKRHFHSGTDLRTNSVEGEIVRAVDSGRILRINVSTSGYGNCIYILHPNGIVSVYGHLQAFNPTIEAYVKRKQYELKKFELELYPSTNALILQQGDLIGWSGNTGSSEGPHLHFELRLNAGTLPYNSYLSGILYNDSTPPQFRNLYVYNIDEKNYEDSFAKRKRISIGSPKKTGQYILLDTVSVSATTGFGVELSDFVNKKSLACNVTELEYYCDGRRLYRFDLNAIAFDETSYADAHVDYALRTQYNKRAHLLFQMPGNFLSRYTTQARGLLHMKKGEIHNIRIRAIDAAGNASELLFAIRSTGEQKTYTTQGSLIAWKSGGTITKNAMQLSIPSGALFADLNLKISSITANTISGAQSPIYILHNENVGLRKSITLTIPKRLVGDSIPADKIYLARWHSKKKRFVYHSVPSQTRSTFVCKLRDFGRYVLLCDTVAPEILTTTWDSVCNAFPLPSAYCFELKIHDSTTAIKTIESTIDNRWALWEYEPKTGQLWHQIDTSQMSRDTNHNLRLILKDVVGNKIEATCSFKTNSNE